MDHLMLESLFVLHTYVRILLEVSSDFHKLIAHVSIFKTYCWCFFFRSLDKSLLAFISAYNSSLPYMLTVR